MVKKVVQGTVKGGRRQGRQRKRWEDNTKEWTDLEFAKSQRAVENRKKRRKLVAKSSVMPQRSSRLRDRWWWWWCLLPRVQFIASLSKLKFYLSTFWVVESLKKLHGGTLATAASANQGHRLPTVDSQVQSFQNLQQQRVDVKGGGRRWGNGKNVKAQLKCYCHLRYHIQTKNLITSHHTTDPVLWVSDWGRAGEFVGKNVKVQHYYATIFLGLVLALRSSDAAPTKIKT